MTAVIVLALAAVISGYAHYEYETPECKIEIHSMRIMGMGELDINKDCEVKAGSENMQRTKQ